MDYLAGEFVVQSHSKKFAFSPSACLCGLCQCTLDSKLIVSLNVSMNGCRSKCVSPAAD